MRGRYTPNGHAPPTYRTPMPATPASGGGGGLYGDPAGGGLYGAMFMPEQLSPIGSQTPAGSTPMGTPEYVAPMGTPEYVAPMGPAPASAPPMPMPAPGGGGMPPGGVVLPVQAGPGAPYQYPVTQPMTFPMTAPPAMPWWGWVAIAAAAGGALWYFTRKRKRGA